MNDVREYARSKGWTFREVSESSGPQLIVSPCPLCGDKDGRPFYISTTTTKFNTYCCGEKGNLYTLKKRFGDIPAKAQKAIEVRDAKSAIAKLRDKAKEKIDNPEETGFKIKPSQVEQWHSNIFREQDKDVLQFLLDRGFTEDTIKRFKLGCVNKDGYSYVTIPSIVDDEVQVLKMRNASNSVPAEKKWQRIKGMNSGLFNASDAINEKHKSRIFICEAELDCVAAWQMGLRPVVASTTGASSFKDDWLEILEDYDEIIFLYDQFDESKKGGHAGDEGAEKAAGKLGKFRCKRAVFPAQDVNKWLQKNPTQSEIDQVVDSSVPYQNNSISRFTDSSKRVRSKGRSPGYKTGIEAIDKLLDGLRENEVTILSADSSIGKTTIGVDICRSTNMTNNNLPVLFWPIEGTERGIVYKLWSQLSGKDHKELSDDEIEEIEKKFDDMKFFILNEGPMSQENVHALVSMFVRRYGLKIFVVDHISKLVQLLTTASMSEKTLIDSWMGFFCNLLKEFDIHIILIAHPTKPKDQDANFEPEMHDLKGSSSLYQDADNVIVLGRKRTKDRSSDEEKARYVATKIIAKKVRSDDAFEGMEIAMFDKKAKRYITIEECNRRGGNESINKSNKDSSNERPTITFKMDRRDTLKDRIQSSVDKMKTSLSTGAMKIKVDSSSAIFGDRCSWCDSGRHGEPCDMCGRNGGNVE